MKKIVLVGLLILLISVGVTQQNEEHKVEQVFLNNQKIFKLDGEAPYTGHYSLTVNEKDLPKSQEKWYLFAMAEPNEQSTLSVPQKIQIRVDKNGTLTLLKECKLVEQTDACFIKNSDFNYTTDKIRYSVHCKDKCEFRFITEVDYSYPLQMNKPFKLNFQETAYSKIFTLNTEGADFYELRITLLPKGFIKYGEPIVLLANYGSQVPTREKHDFQGIHIWDDGQGIFIRKTELKDRKLTILVEGPQKNILLLSAKGWQKQQRVQLLEYYPEFDLLKTGQSRDFSAYVTRNITHRIRVITFSGAVETTNLFKLQGEVGKQQLIPLNFATPNQKYGQFQYRISKQTIQKQGITKFLIRVTAKKQTTYLINYAKQQQQISALLPHFSQTSYMQPGQADQYYIKVQQIIETAREKKNSKIQIIIGNINGNVNAKFYKCNVAKKAGVDHIKQCQIKDSNKQQFTQANPTKTDNRGGEKRYWFDIEWLDYVKKNEKQRTQIVYQMVVIVQNANDNKASSYEIQYKNKDRIYLLREGQTTKDRVSIDEKRHYKLSVQDADATQIRIHTTKISGEVLFFGTTQDPRQKKNHQKILPVYGIISYQLNPNKKVNQVYLQVNGIDNALYSITTQIIRKTSGKNNTNYNELIVKQDINYQFIIGPSQSIVLQLHLVYKEFIIHMKASSAIQICMTQNLKSPPFPPNCQISNNSVLELDQRFFMEKGLVGNIGLRNNHNDVNVTVKVRLAKPSGSSDEDPKCQIAPMNQVFWERAGPDPRAPKKNTTDESKQQTHCVQFFITRHAEIQLTVDIRGETKFSDGKITANIYDEQIVKVMQPTYIFTKEEVESACKGKNYDKQTSFCSLRIKLQKIKNTRVLILVQYTDQPVRLLDGLAHSVHGTVKKIQPKYFYLGIHNYENITVFLQNKIGEYKIYASLMKYQLFHEEMPKRNTSIFPTKQTKDLQSSNPFYYLQQMIVIPKQKIQQKCPQKTGYRIACVLLISVVLDGSNDVIKNGKFVLQATQQNRQLKDGVPLNGYLQKKSVAFYHYQNQKSNGTIIVNVNNQNKNCLDIYVRQGSQRASASNNEKHLKGGNTLLVPKVIMGTYSVTVQANQNCQYTIQITSTSNNLTRIKKGSFRDVKLAQNQITYMLYQNEINETFKILSSHKSGQVIISVNPIQKDKLQTVLTGDLNAINDWIWVNKDSVKINYVSNRTSSYCADCYYLIKIQASRQTQASIVIPTPGSQLPITTDSLIKDMLSKNQQAVFRVFTQSSSQFQIYVQYGKIQVSIIEPQKKNQVYKKTFVATKAPVIQTFNLTKTQSYQYLRYSKVKILALEQSYFSFAVISNSDPNRRGSGLKYGIPQYVFIQSNLQKCVLGNMMQSLDQFLLSFSKVDKKYVDELQIKIKMNQKQVSYDRQVGKNQMVLRINQLGYKSDSPKFDICMKSKQPLSITIIQTSPVNYWPDKQPIVVRRQLNMTFGSQGKNIIQINQCKSRAITQIFSQFGHLKTSKSQIKQRRRSNNIVQFYHFGPVYIHLKSQKATMRWFPVNESSGAGLGYDDYKTSWIRILKKGDAIQATAQPIKPINDADVKSKIQSIQYTFYAAKQQIQLYGAMNCAEGDYVQKRQIIDLVAYPSKSKQLATVLFNIQKQLLPKFGKFNYFLIGMRAQLIVKNLQGEREDYRFYYPYQQVSRETLTSENVNPIEPQTPQKEGDETSFYTYVGYLLLGILILALTYCIYTKFCAKAGYKKHRLNQSAGVEMKYTDFADH